MQFASVEAEHHSIGQPSHAVSGYAHPMYGTTEQSTNRYVPMQVEMGASQEPAQEPQPVADKGGSCFAAHLPYAEAVLQHAQLIQQSCGHLETQLHASGLYREQMQPPQRNLSSGAPVSDDRYVQLHTEIEHAIQQLKLQHRRPGHAMGRAKSGSSRFDRLCEDLICTEKLHWTMDLEQLHQHLPRHNAALPMATGTQCQGAKRARWSNASVEKADLLYQRQELLTLKQMGEEKLKQVEEFAKEHCYEHENLISQIEKPGLRLLANLGQMPQSKQAFSMSFQRRHIARRQIVHCLEENIEGLRHHKIGIADLGRSVARMQGESVEKYIPGNLTQQIRDIWEAAAQKLEVISGIFEKVDNSLMSLYAERENRAIRAAKSSSAPAFDSALHTDDTQRWFTWDQYFEWRARQRNQRKLLTLSHLLCGATNTGAVELTNEERLTQLQDTIKRHANLVIKPDTNNGYVINPEWVLDIAKATNPNYLGTLIGLLRDSELSGVMHLNDVCEMYALENSHEKAEDFMAQGEDGAAGVSEKYSTLVNEIQSFWKACTGFLEQSIWVKLDDDSDERHKRFATLRETLSSYKKHEAEVELRDCIAKARVCWPGIRNRINGAESGQFDTWIRSAPKTGPNSIHDEVKALLDELNDSAPDEAKTEFCKILIEAAKENPVFEDLKSIYEQISNEEEKEVAEKTCYLVQLRLLDDAKSKELMQKIQDTYSTSSDVYERANAHVQSVQREGVNFFTNLICKLAEEVDAFNGDKPTIKPQNSTVSSYFENLWRRLFGNKDSEQPKDEKPSDEEGRGASTRTSAWNEMNGVLAASFEWSKFKVEVTNRLELLNVFLREDAFLAKPQWLKTDQLQHHADVLWKEMLGLGYIPDVAFGYNSPFKSHISGNTCVEVHLEHFAQQAYWLLACIAELASMGWQFEGHNYNDIIIGNNEADVLHTICMKLGLMLPFHGDQTMQGLEEIFKYTHLCLIEIMSEDTDTNEKGQSALRVFCENSKASWYVVAYMHGYFLLCALTFTLYKQHVFSSATHCDEPKLDKLVQILQNVCLSTMQSRGNSVVTLLSNYEKTNGPFVGGMLKDNDRVKSGLLKNGKFGVVEHLGAILKQCNLSTWADEVLKDLEKDVPPEVQQVIGPILYAKLHPVPLKFEDAVLPLFDAGGMVRGVIDQMYICTIAQQVLSDLLNKHPHLRTPEMSLELMYDEARNDFFNEFVQLINMQEQLTKRYSGTRVTYARDAQRVARHYQVMCFVFGNARVTMLQPNSASTVKQAYLIDSRVSKQRISKDSMPTPLPYNTCEIMVRGELVRSLQEKTVQMRQEKVQRDQLAQQRLDEKLELEALMAQCDAQNKVLEVDSKRLANQIKEQQLAHRQLEIERKAAESEFKVQQHRERMALDAQKLELEKLKEENRTQLATAKQNADREEARLRAEMEREKQQFQQQLQTKMSELKQNELAQNQSRFLTEHARKVSEALQKHALAQEAQTMKKAKDLYDQSKEADKTQIERDKLELQAHKLLCGIDIEHAQFALKETESAAKRELEAIKLDTNLNKIINEATDKERKHTLAELEFNAKLNQMHVNAEKAANERDHKASVLAFQVSKHAESIELQDAKFQDEKKRKDKAEELQKRAVDAKYDQVQAQIKLNNIRKDRAQIDLNIANQSQLDDHERTKLFARRNQLDELIDGNEKHLEQILAELKNKENPVKVHRLYTRQLESVSKILNECKDEREKICAVIRHGTTLGTSGVNQYSMAF